MAWEPLPDAHSEPKRVGESLDSLMQRLVGASVSTIEVVMDQWPTIVGDALASASSPVKIRDGVLTIRTGDPVVASELRWLEPTIIQQVAELADGTTLTKVSVTVAGVR